MATPYDTNDPNQTGRGPNEPDQPPISAGESDRRSYNPGDPNQRRYNVERREMRDLQRRGWYGRGGGWIGWRIVAMVILIAFFWYAGWGWGGYGGWWWGSRTQRTVSVPVTGSGAAILNATDSNRVSFVGKLFTLRNARVERVVTPTVFWIGNGAQRPMLMVVTTGGGTTEPSINVGDLVGASGIVQKAPPPQQAKQEWNLDQTGMRQLERQQAYLQTGYVAKIQGRANAYNSGNGNDDQAGNRLPR
jgi:hypothetical protein